jgi:hypothetical protein
MVYDDVSVVERRLWQSLTAGTEPALYGADSPVRSRCYCTHCFISSYSPDTPTRFSLPSFPLVCFPKLLPLCASAN